MNSSAGDTHQSFYDQLDSRLKIDFPGTAELIAQQTIFTDWRQLVSPFHVTLSEAHLQKMKTAIQDLFLWSRPANQTTDIQNFSVLMSYDFHTDENGETKLIEINTNASGYLIAALSEATHSQKSLHELSEIHALKSSFERESGSAQKINIAIVDDDILNQKMRIEFYLYKELFERWGWTCEICEAKDLRTHNSKVLTPSGLALDFIYNRTTDFLLTEPSHRTLHQAWSDHLCVVSPQPKEYQKLADKERLLRLQSERSHLSSAIQDVLLRSFDLSHFRDPEDLWQQRKQFFFKPKNSFGGKSVYKGQSITKKVFERLLSEDPMIQENFPPQKLNEWKFDVRCYAYKGELQFTSARLYQGQITNFSSLYGGFGPVRLKS